MMMVDSQINQVNTITLEQINDYSFYKIVNFLDLISIANLLKAISSSKVLRTLSQHDQMYKIVCHSSLFEDEEYIAEKKPEGISYREYFLDNWKRVKEYKAILKNLIDPCLKAAQEYSTDLQELFAQNINTSFFKDLQIEKPYISDKNKIASIKSITKQSYDKISKDILILYRLLNGQQEISGLYEDPFSGQGLFGSFSSGNREVEHLFVSFTNPICGFLATFKALPFVYLYPIKKYLYIDASNMLGFGYQTVFSFFQSNQNGDGKNFLIYIYRTSLDSFMSSLSQNNWVNEDNFYRNVDTLFNPGSDTTTQGIRIRATAKHSFFEVGQSEDTFLYVYSIRISAQNIPQGKKYKLRTRKWLITSDDPTINPQVVNGPGVVGYYPEMYDGVADFVYMSCCYMNGNTGRMEGSFQFEDLQTGEIVDAKINPFLLKPIEGEKLISFNIESKERIIIFE